MEYDHIKKVYHLYSDFYDHLFKHVFYPRMSYAINTMNIQPGDKVLDVGIGTGISLTIYPEECHVTGIDLSASMLKKAREKRDSLKLEHVDLHEMDACELEFDDNTFDHVIATFVMSVVPDPVKALSEMKRVCKKDKSVVMVNHFLSDNRLLAKLETIFDPLCKRLGWCSTVALSPLAEEVDLQVDSCIRMKKFDPWSIVFATNTK